VRWLGLGLIVCLICLYRYERVHFSKAAIVGTYELEGQNCGSRVLVNADGSFSYIDDKDVKSGTWRLIDEKYLLYDTGIEFNGRTSGSGYANEYLLTRRGPNICWEVREGEEYWCKKDGK
jgi:hypothetical protein